MWLTDPSTRASTKKDTTQQKREEEGGLTSGGGAQGASAQRVRKLEERRERSRARPRARCSLVYTPCGGAGALVVCRCDHVIDVD